MQLQPGFSYAPSTYHPPIGHSRLEIILLDPKLENKDDLKRVRFTVFDRGDMKEMIISHPWLGNGQNTYRITPGRFRIWEKDEDIHYGLCLGGELNINREGDFTRCLVYSNAPIFNLQDEINSPGMMLASEVEALLAERRAAWGENEEAFVQKLSQIDPLRLFSALVARIEEEQKLIPGLARGESYWKEEHILRTIIKSLDTAGHWPVRPDRLEDLI